MTRLESTRIHGGRGVGGHGQSGRRVLTQPTWPKLQEPATTEPKAVSRRARRSCWASSASAGWAPGLDQYLQEVSRGRDRGGLRRLRASPLTRASRPAVSPAVFSDFRRVLDRKDIDAVVIATPDHWHGITTILACQAGKDVYCEKPLAHRIQEGRAMVQAVEKYKRITQMGNLIHAGENYHRVVEIVRSGVLGKISKTRVWMAADRSGLGRPADSAPPAGCDYDFWLGPAPKRPFNPNRFTFNWRYFWDYGGGILTDFCCHIVDLVHWAMEVDAPRTISATGGRYALADNAEVPDTLEVTYEYEKAGQKFLMVWSQTDANAHGLENQGLGIMFQGTEATLVADYGSYQIIPEKGQKIDEPPKTPAALARPSPRVAQRDQEPGPVLVPLRLRPSPDDRRQPGQHLALDRRKAGLGPGRRADHQPPRSQPVPDQGIPQALDAPHRLMELEP